MQQMTHISSIPKKLLFSTAYSKQKMYSEENVFQSIQKKRTLNHIFEMQ